MTRRHSRSAIARGALLRGLDGSIVMARRAPRHYGSLAHCLLTSACPPGAREHAYLCQNENVMLVPGVIQWYVEKVGTHLLPSRDIRKRSTQRAYLYRAPLLYLRAPSFTAWFVYNRTRNRISSSGIRCTAAISTRRPITNGRIRVVNRIPSQSPHSSI